MLRKIRIVAATICFTLITLLFLDFTGTLHLWFGWLAKIQFLPAVLALNVGVVAFLVILTLIQTSSVDRMIQLLRYIGFVRRTVQAIATSSIFTDMMIFKR